MPPTSNEKLGITVSIGLSCNKFLAKIASDLDKPRGFAVLGASEAQAFLADKPVSFIFGVGKVSAARFARDGFHRIADLQRVSEVALMRRYGEEGRRLARLARGIDARKVSADRETKSVSAETTFDRDIADFRSLERILWSQAEEVSARLKARALAGSTVTLKLKTADFRIRTRARSLGSPTQLAGQDLRRRTQPARTRNRRHQIPPARRRRERAHHGGSGRSRPISSTAARPRPSMRSTAFVPASATTPWSGGWRSKDRRSADARQGQGLGALISSEVSLPVTTNSL